MEQAVFFQSPVFLTITLSLRAVKRDQLVVLNKVAPHNYVSLCGVLRVQFQKPHGRTASSCFFFFLSVDPWSWSSFLETLLTRIIRDLIIHMNTSFLIHKERDSWRAGQVRHWVTRPERWCSVGESGRLSVPGVSESVSLPRGLSSNQGANAPIFPQSRRSPRNRPGHTCTCPHLHLPGPTDKHRQTLIVNLSFSVRTSIFTLWHCHRLMWFISAQFIWDYSLVSNDILEVSLSY